MRYPHGAGTVVHYADGTRPTTGHVRPGKQISQFVVHPQCVVCRTPGSFYVLSEQGAGVRRAFAQMPCVQEIQLKGGGGGAQLGARTCGGGQLSDRTDLLVLLLGRIGLGWISTSTLRTELVLQLPWEKRPHRHVLLLL